jgi:hypothetical protein
VCSLTLHHDYTVDLTEQVDQWVQAWRDKLLAVPATSSMAAFFIGINDTGDTKGWKNVSGISLFKFNELIARNVDHRLDSVLEYRDGFVLWGRGKYNKPCQAVHITTRHVLPAGTSLPNRPSIVPVPQCPAYGPCPGVCQ